MDLTGAHFGVRRVELCIFFSKSLISCLNPFFLTDSKWQYWHLRKYHMLLFVCSINRPLFNWAGNILFYLLWLHITVKHVLNLVFPCITPILMLLFLAIFTCMFFQINFRSTWSSLLKFYWDVAEFKD